MKTSTIITISVTLNLIILIVSHGLNETNLMLIMLMGILFTLVEILNILERKS